MLRFIRFHWPFRVKWRHYTSPSKILLSPPSLHGANGGHRLLPKSMREANLQHFNSSFVQDFGENKTSTSDDATFIRASASLKQVLHDTRAVLKRSPDDKETRALCLSILEKHILGPAYTTNLPPDVLTLGIQALGDVGEVDKACELYYTQKERDTVSVQHLTVVLKVFRGAIEDILDKFAVKWSNVSEAYRDSMDAVESIKSRDEEIYALVMTALEHYEELVRTSPLTWQ